MPEKAKSKILIVEDEGVVAKDIQGRLERLGYAIVGIAYSGDKAVETAGRLSPHLVLMDIKLRGDMDGIEAARQIRDRFNIPVVYLTAYTDDMTLKFAKTAEPYGYIVKPFGDRELHSTISMALYKHKAEETLKESEEKFRSFTQNAPDFVIQLDHEGMILYTNRTYGDVSVEDVVGTSIFAWLEQEFRPAFRKALTHVFKTAESQVLEYLALGPEGETRWYSGHIGPLKTNESTGSVILIARDITECKKAEEELKQSKEFIANVINALDDPVFVKDEEHRWAVLNDAACEVMGRPREELIGKSDYDLFPKEQADVFWERDNHVLNNGRTDVNEEEITWHGKLHTISTKKSVFTDSLTGKKFIAGTIRDITERKRAEETIRNSENFLSSIIEQSPFSTWIADANGTNIRQNAACRKLFGIDSDEETVGKYNIFSDTVLKEQEEHLKEIKKVFEESKTVRFSIDYDFSKVKTVKVPKATHTLLDVTIFPIKDANGRVINAVVQHEDITERKKAEEALRQSREKLRKHNKFLNNVLESLTHPFYVTDANDYTIKMANSAANFGSLKEGSTCYALTHNRDVPCGGEKHPCPLKEIKKTKKPVTTEHIHYDKDGKERYVEVHGYPIFDSRGNVTGIIEYSLDITKRKKAEEALQESENRYRTLFESAPMGIAVATREGQLLEFNNAVLQMTGYSDTAIRQINTRDLYQNPDKRALILKQLEANGFVHDFEVQMKRKDRTLFYASLTVTPFTLCGKDVLLTAVKDITERKKAEEALRESKEFSENLVASMKDGFSVLDTRGVHLHVNEALCCMTGFTREELIGTGPPHAYWPKEGYENIEKAFQETVKRKFEDFELIFKRKNGEHFPVIVSPSYLRDKKGKIVSYFATVKDITERKKAEEALREREEQLELFFGQSLDGFFFMMLDEPVRWDDTVDKEKVMDYVFAHHRITKVNDAMLEQYGATRQQFIGMTPNDLYTHDIAYGIDVWKRFFDAGRLHVETDERKLDGTPVWIEGDYICLYDTKGRITGHFGIQRDITERKNAEEQVLDYQAQLKSLASQLSLAEEHERRRIATELHDQIAQSLVVSKHKLEALHVSVASEELGNDLNEVCNSLGRTIAETRSLMFDIHSPLLSLLGFEEAVAELLAEQIGEKHGIATEFEDDGQPKPLDDDIRVLLFRDVRELLTNVVRHANAKRVKVAIHKVGSELQVSVEDDGVGFDLVKVTSGAVREGAFGLFSIHERLELSGGHLEIESKPGHGTRITMMAPLQGVKKAEGRKI